MIRNAERLNVLSTRGVTLVELMITIAVLSILIAIAIPAYNGYVREGHYTAIRATINSMRTPIEDFRLDNGNYGAAGNLAGQAAIDGRFGWEPGTDTGAYNYTVAVVGTNNYHVWGQLSAAVWVRCQDRMSNCCDSDATGATGPSAACP